MLFPNQTPTKTYTALLLALAIGQYYLAQQFLLPALLLTTFALLINHLINTHYQFHNTTRFQNAIINTFTDSNKPTINTHVATFFSNAARALHSPLHLNLVTKEALTTYKKTMITAALQCLIIEAIMLAIIYYGFQYLTGHNLLQSFVLIYAAVRPAHICISRVPTKHTQFTEQINQIFFDAVGKRLTNITPLITNTVAECIDILIARSTKQTNPADALYAKTIIQYFEQFQANTQIDPSIPNQPTDNPTPQELQQYTLLTLQPRIQQLQQLYPNT